MAKFNVSGKSKFAKVELFMGCGNTRPHRPSAGCRKNAWFSEKHPKASYF